MVQGLRLLMQGAHATLQGQKKFFNEKQWETVTSCQVAREETPPEQNWAIKRDWKELFETLEPDLTQQGGENRLLIFVREWWAGASHYPRHCGDWSREDSSPESFGWSQSGQSGPCHPKSGIVCFVGDWGPGADSGLGVSFLGLQ